MAATVGIAICLRLRFSGFMSVIVRDPSKCDDEPVSSNDESESELNAQGHKAFDRVHERSSYCIRISMAAVKQPVHIMQSM